MILMEMEKQMLLKQRYAYLKNGREDERENAMLENQSGKCCMKRGRDAGCYSEFIGQFFFDLQKLEKIIGEEREL